MEYITEWIIGAITLGAMGIVCALVVSNVRMMNRVLKDMEDQRKQPWNWN